MESFVASVPIGPRQGVSKRNREQFTLSDGQVPAPLRAAVCGLPPPLSLTAISAVRLPLAEGVKVTVMKQLVPDATLLSQVLV